MDFRDYVRRHLPPIGVAREAEIVEELAHHVEEIYREARGAGLDHGGALDRVRRALSAPDDTVRQLREASATTAARAFGRWQASLDEPPARGRGLFALVSDLRRDLRLAARSLLRAPGFTAVAAVTLALGIGATTVVFSAVDNVLLQHPPIRDPERAVTVHMLRPAQIAAGAELVGPSSSYLDFADLRDSGRLAGLAAYANTRLALHTPDGAERIDAQVVSGNFFDVLGVVPQLGRAFAVEEDAIGSPVRVAVISDGLWRGRFGADATIVGRTLTLNGNPYTVVGVAPRGFTGPLIDDAPEAWVPLALQPEVRPPSAGALRRRLGTLYMLDAREVRWLGMVGRLHDGQSIEEAAAAVGVIGNRLAAAHPESNGELTATAVALGEGQGVRRQTRPVLMLLGIAVGLVLLIACTNVAGLLLIRAVTRRREVGVRIALGASRGPLVRQWLAEALVIAMLAAIGGLVLVGWGTPVLYGLGVPETVDLSIDGRVLLFALAVATVTALVFGLAPLLQFTRHDAAQSLREQGGRVAGGRRVTHLQASFVVVQVAISFVLLVGAGLFLRTLQQAYAVDLGYDIEEVLLADATLGEAFTPETGAPVYRELLERLNDEPGIASAAAARVAVLSGSARTGGVSVDGEPIRPDGSNAIPVRANVVTPAYFETMQIPLLRGRRFAAADGPGAPPVAIVSRSLAERLWPGADGIGRTVVTETAALQVIGIVPDTVYLRTTEPAPMPLLYQPLAQNYETGVTLHVRTRGEPMSVLPAVRRVVRDLDPRIVVSEPRRMVEEFDQSVMAQRTLARVTGMLSGMALLLAAIGLYGTLAYLVRQRTIEIGVRLALGATPSGILRLVAGTGARLVALGAVMGLAGAWAGAAYMRGQLFGVEPTDPITWIGVSLLLLAVAVIACAVPARRAMGVAPAQVLRSA